MVPRHGGSVRGVRHLQTVRISVTGRCDLDCSYCDTSPAARDSHEFSPREIALLAEAASLAGARTVRITGGEPLLRGDIEEIVARLRHVRGLKTIAVTTNAQRLAPRAGALRSAGLDRVNIGLPSLRPEVYRRMTGGEVGPALAGLEAAIVSGLEPVKLNVVVLDGDNVDEIPDFIELARANPVEVRFIERMPFARSDGLVTASDIREKTAAAVGRGRLGSPQFTPTAELYSPSGFAGRIGMIAPVTEPFCERCDRLRVTCDGRLRACLSEAQEVDLRGMLSAGADVERIASAFEAAFAQKPVRHRASFSGRMRRIGG